MDDGKFQNLKTIFPTKEQGEDIKGKIKKTMTEQFQNLIEKP